MVTVSIRKLTVGVGALFLALLCNSCTRTAATEPFVQGGPPLGKYKCWAGGFDNLPSGEFTLLPGGKYQDYRKIGGGTYLYNPASATLQFVTGDFEYWDFVAVWQHAEGGKHPERLVMRYRGDNTPLESVREGRYQLCYIESQPVQTAAKR